MAISSSVLARVAACSASSLLRDRSACANWSLSFSSSRDAARDDALSLSAAASARATSASFLAAASRKDAASDCAARSFAAISALSSSTPFLASATSDLSDRTSSFFAENALTRRAFCDAISARAARADLRPASTSEHRSALRRSSSSSVSSRPLDLASAAAVSSWAPRAPSSSSLSSLISSPLDLQSATSCSTVMVSTSSSVTPSGFVGFVHDRGFEAFFADCGDTAGDATRAPAMDSAARSELPLAAALASVCADGLPAPFIPPFIIPVAWRTALA